MGEIEMDIVGFVSFTMVSSWKLMTYGIEIEMDV